MKIRTVRILETEESWTVLDVVTKCDDDWWERNEALALKDPDYLVVPGRLIQIVGEGYVKTYTEAR